MIFPFFPISISIFQNSPFPQSNYSIGEPPERILTSNTKDILLICGEKDNNNKKIINPMEHKALKRITLLYS